MVKILSVKFSFMVEYWEFQTSFIEGIHVEKHLSSKFKLLIVGTFVMFISICKCKTSSEMSSLYKKKFAWRILFAKLNNRNSSNSKAILNKEQTCCPPSDWWHSTFSAFFFKYNALWQLYFVVQVARNFCRTCIVTVN